MLSYILRRFAYGALVVLGVLVFLFFLFFAVATPDDIARRSVGEKATPAVIEQWKINHGYDRPLFPGPGHYKDNLFVRHMTSMLTFDLGRSDADGVPIKQRIAEGAGPSLALSVPLFFLELFVSVVVSLFVAFFRETYFDRIVLVFSVFSMSVSILLYIIGGQFLFGTVLRWFPLSGFDSSPSLLFRFLALPVLVGVFASVGSSIRFYRTVFLEEVHKDYVRTARAKGASELRIMLKHVLPNAMIPILTNVVMAIPFLFTGSLLLEAGFGIPGLGALTVEAINANDFSTLRAMVFIGSLLFVLGQVLTDIAYTIVDPRVTLE
ncbi:MAG: peptide ABC transporter permease [Sorangiineae bacterium NIC37A_2]|jgi:peptide/nickel transport system permease protein|nr:MAG: peptide ABC transporter permease [Sorangiineae bacterium NIC37A_2]